MSETKYVRYVTINAIISIQYILLETLDSSILTAASMAIVGSGGQMVYAHITANSAAIIAPMVCTVFVIDCLYAAAAPTNAMPAQERNAVNWNAAVVAESIGGSIMKATVHIAKVNIHGCLLT